MDATSFCQSLLFEIPFWLSHLPCSTKNKIHSQYFERIWDLFLPVCQQNIVLCKCFRSEALRGVKSPRLCQFCALMERKENKWLGWWRLDWTHFNWWVPWPEGVCAWMCARALLKVLVLCRLNYCNGALKPEELNSRGHTQKMVTTRKIILKANHSTV